MTNYIKEHHTNIFTGQTGCGKIHLVLDLNKNTKNISTISLSFVQHFEIIKRTREWIKNDDKIWLIQPKDNLYQWIGKLLQLLARFKTIYHR